MPIHIENFHIFLFPRRRRDKNSRRNSQCIDSVDLPSFDQTLSKLPEKIWLQVVISPYFSFTIYIQFILSRLESAGAPGI